MRFSLLVACVVAVLFSPAVTTAQSGPSTAIVKPQPSPDSWSFTTYIDGYIAPHSSFLASPIFTADHDQLHLEARYGYEDRYLGSLWAGYNFTAGTSLKLALTPMLGVVFGQQTGVAPGLEGSLSYKRFYFSSSAQYVFAVKNRQSNFFYGWPQLAYAQRKWFRPGSPDQHAKVFTAKFKTECGR